MKKALLIFTAILFFFFNGLNNVFTQNIQHLEAQVKKATSWEEKLDLYIQIADTTMWIGENIDQSKKYAELALEICETHDCGDRKAIARALLAEFAINRGNFKVMEEVLLPSLQLNDFRSEVTRAQFQELAGSVSLLSGNPTDGIKRLTEAQDILEAIKPNSKRLSNVYLYLAYSHNVNSTNDSSILFMEKSIEHAKLSNDTLKICDGLIGLKTLYTNDGKLTKSIALLLEAKELVENSNIAKDRIYNIYDGLSYTYIRNGDYDKAEKELETIIPKYRALKAPIEAKASTMWSYYLSYALLMRETKRYDKGLEYVDSAYVYAAYLNDFSVLITDMRRASINLEYDNYELSSMQIKAIMDKAKALGNSDAVNAVVVDMLADLYMESSLKPSTDFQKDLEEIVERIKQKNKGAYNMDLLNANELSTILAIYRNDTRAALDGLLAITSIRDTLQTKAKQEVSDELFVKYETEKKDKEIEISRLKLNRQTYIRNALIGGVLALTGIAVVLFLFFQQKRKHAAELEKEVAQRTTELQKSNQALMITNEELERYTYIASHDLKEPLRNVVSFVGILKRKGLVKEEEAAHYFEFIENGALQMNEIVKDLLAFSDLRKMDVVSQNVSMTQMIDNVKNALQDEITEKRVVLETYNLPKSITSDEGMLFMIFKNLIENAIKFNESTMPFIKIQYKEQSDLHIFNIVDNGIGIDKEYHDQVFEMFKRLHDRSKYKGSGIGLAICKRTVGYLGGVISVKNNDEQGVTFTIKLPKTQTA